jgi:hypothetical protein
MNSLSNAPVLNPKSQWWVLQKLRVNYLRAFNQQVWRR